MVADFWKGDNSTISTASNLTFTKPLYFGLTNTDVKDPQTYLKTDSSVYPEGLITGYFGTLTKKAVQRFQDKYNLASKTDPAYGYVGPKTRAKLNGVFGK